MKLFYTKTTTHFKRLLAVLLLVTLVCVACFGLSACNNKDVPDNSAGVTVTLKVIDIDGTSLFSSELTTTQSYLLGVLIECDRLEINTTSSPVGSWLNAVSVGHVVEMPASEWGPAYKAFVADATIVGDNVAYTKYIYVGHDIDRLSFKDLTMPTVTVSGKTYYASNYGVSQLPVVSGATYVLKLSTY